MQSIGSCSEVAEGIRAISGSGCHQQGCCQISGQEQFDTYPANAGFTAVLDPIAIEILPDQIAKRRRSPVAEILAPVIGVWRQGKS